MAAPRPAVPTSATLPLAFAHLREGRLREAEALCRTILARQPDDAGALHCLGLAALQARDFPAAVDRLGRAAALTPGDAILLANLGIALRSSRQAGAAAGVLEAALAGAPGNGEILFHLGCAYFESRAFDRAAATYRQAIAAGNRRAEVYGNLGCALEESGAFAAAAEAYEAALALLPSFAQAHTNLGNSVMALGQCARALACHRRALAIDPDFAQAQANLIFALNFDPAATVVEHQRERALWYERHARRFATMILPHGNRPEPERRLRIGYVSGHFRHQAAAYAFAPVIIGHDRTGFEVVCYSDTVLEDAMTERLRAAAEGWRRIVDLNDDQVAALIRDDGIDVLVDLAGHMSGNRLFVFARKPAPVQVTGWGEPTGTGLATMDYLLADPVLVPMEWRPLLAETVIDLPCFLGYWTPEPLPDPGPLPALANGHVTFGSFNRLSKTSDEVLRCWAAILRAVPTARLVLKAAGGDDPGQQARIRGLLAGEGISGARVTMLGNAWRAEHFAAWRMVDLALDPFPHGGGMTTLDAACMGVPTVTAPGQTISSRLAAACNVALGLDDFVAPDRAAYVALAAAKAADRDGLAALRQSLRARVAASPVGDSAAYASAVEAAYRAIWRIWCAGGRGGADGA